MSIFPHPKGEGKTQITQNSAGIIHLSNGQIAVEIVIESGVPVAQKTIPQRLVIQRPRPAIAYDAAVVDEMARRGVQFLRVTIIETRQMYMVRFDEFQRNASRFNRGYGEQLMLPLSQWSTPGQWQHSQQPEQISMFAGVTK